MAKKDAREAQSLHGKRNKVIHDNNPCGNEPADAAHVYNVKEDHIAVCYHADGTKFDHLDYCKAMIALEKRGANLDKEALGLAHKAVSFVPTNTRAEINEWVGASLKLRTH